MSQIAMHDDNDDDVDMLVPLVDDSQLPPDRFQDVDTVQAFLTHGYVSSSHAHVNQMGRLSSINKLFQRAVKSQLSKNTDWLQPATLQADMFKLRIDDDIAETKYLEFFDGVHAARIIPAVLQKALCAMHKHMQTDAVVRRMQVFDNNAIAAEASQRCRIVASVMHYHCDETAIVLHGATILGRLLGNDRVLPIHFPQIAATLIAALQRYSHRNCVASEIIITALFMFVEKRPLAADACCLADGDVVAYVFAGMRENRTEDKFQKLGLELVMKLTASSKWLRGTRPRARGTRNEFVDAVWLQGVENRLVQVMHEQQNVDAVRVSGCHALANMGCNNLREMKNTKELALDIVNFMQMYASGRCLHATAMASATALCVKAFSYDASGAHVQNQNLFLSAGVLPMMLAAVNSYARGSVHWPMMTAVAFVQGLDAMCRDNYPGTARFINANGIGIIIFGAFYLQMSTEGNIINFKSEIWAGTFVMLYQILSHRVKKRPTEDGDPQSNSSSKKIRASTASSAEERAGAADTTPIATSTSTTVGVGAAVHQGQDQNANSTDTHTMPFLNQISKKFFNTFQVKHAKREAFGITDLALLCIADKVNPAKSRALRATDSVVQQCLELLCICMLKRAGIQRMVLDGIETILQLKAQNAAQTRKCVITDVLCMKVLAIAITRSLNVNFDQCTALLSVAMRTVGMPDGMQVKVPAKQIDNPKFIDGVRTAQHFVNKLRNGLLRIVLRQSMLGLLKRGTDIDEADRTEMKRHVFIPASMDDGPKVLHGTDAQQVRSCGPSHVAHVTLSCSALSHLDASEHCASAAAAVASLACTVWHTVFCY
jgi:hypothetical protein